jgi:hypothetical protein
MCPAEISKTSRLTEHARRVFADAECEVDLLDLSRLTAEYGRRIFQCKACVPTPCPSVTDHALGYHEPNATSHQVLDRDDKSAEEVRHAARTLVEPVGRLRRGETQPGTNLTELPPK